MSNNIELLSNTENFTIGTNSNLSEILANVVRVGTDTSKVTISTPQDISSSYNLILPVRQGASGESLVYGADGQLKWDDPTVLKKVVTVFGSNLGSNKVDSGEMTSVTFPTNYEASITPLSANTKIFVQFKVNYHAALSASNQISFFIKKSYDGNETIFTESLFGPYNGAGGFTGQYISNLIDESNTTNEIIYKLGYKINGNVYASDVLGILGYDTSHNNTIVLQEFEGSGVYATSVWNKGSDSNGLYYNEGTVHIGSSKDALGSQNTAGVALELSGNLVGTNANFSGNINAETFIGDLSGNVNAVTIAATTTTTNNLSLDGTLTTSNSSRVVGNLIPSVDDTYSLGAPDRVWKDVYIGPGSLYLNGTKILDDSSNTINMRTDTDQALNIQTSGTGTLTMHSSGTGALNIEGGGPLTINSSGNSALELNSGTGGIDFNTSNTGSINFNSSNSGTINFNSDIVLQGNISMIQTGTSNPINLNDDVNVNGNLKVNRINREDIGYSALYLESVKVDGSSITGQLIGNVIGHVTGTVSSISNLDTDNLSEGSTNLYYTTDRVRGDVSGGLGINYNESTGVFSLPQEVSSSSDVTFDNVTASSSLVTHNAQINNDLTLSGCLRGPSTMYIDPATHGDDTGTLIVKGDLQVLGTTTTIDSETLLIADNNIILNNNYEGTLGEDASIEINRGTSLDNAIIKWNEANYQWEFYKEGTTLSNIKCNTLKVSDATTLGITSVSVSSTTLNINGHANSSYGVYSLSDSTTTTIDTISVTDVGNNSQILIYYTNSSGSDLTINNTITGCKTNLSEELTVSSGSSVLFCLVNINSTYILTVSQLY